MPRRYVAIYDYDPEEMSPNDNPEEELGLKEGQVLKVFGDVGEDGFFMAELNGKRGLVPSNFIEELPVEGEGAQSLLLENKDAVGGNSLVRRAASRARGPSLGLCTSRRPRVLAGPG